MSLRNTSRTSNDPWNYDELHFDMTADHITLIRSLNIHATQWAAYVDEKRPYGNSDVTSHIIEMCGWTTPAGMTLDEAEEALRARAGDLDHEIPTALSIVLATGSFAPGRYERNDIYGGWKAPDDAATAAASSGVEQEGNEQR